MTIDEVLDEVESMPQEDIFLINDILNNRVRDLKRKELIKRITSSGCILLRHGQRHDLYLNPHTGKKQPVPRHNEIDENLSRHIIKELT